MPAGAAVSVVAGAADVSVLAGAAVEVVAGVELVLLVVDGSPAGLLSLPPQAARTAMAERTRSFFIIVASRAAVFRCLSACRQGKAAGWDGECANQATIAW